MLLSVVFACYPDAINNVCDGPCPMGTGQVCSGTAVSGCYCADYNICDHIDVPISVKIADADESYVVLKCLNNTLTATIH